MNPFTWPWKVYLIGGVLIALFGVLSVFVVRDSDTERAKALSRPAPKLVAIQSFTWGSGGPANEINISAQVDVNRWVELTRENDSGIKWTIIPLFATDAETSDGPALGMIATRGAMAKEQIKKLIVGQGVVGPVVALNGEKIDDPRRDFEVSRAMKGSLKTVPDPLVVEPYERGRKAALQPIGLGLPTAIIIMGVLIVGYSIFRRYREPIEEANFYA